MKALLMRPPTSRLMRSCLLGSTSILPAPSSRKITTFISLSAPSSTSSHPSTATPQPPHPSQPVTDLKSFQGQTALVTGGTSGIGFECAKAFRSLGARIILVGRDEGRLRNALSLLREQVTEVHIGVPEWDGDAVDGVTSVVADVSRIGEVEAVIKTVMQKYGPVDYLINSAGISRTGLLVNSVPEQSEELIATNLFGTIHMSRGIARGMLRRKRGCIINISSVLGLKGVEGGSVYSASKAGVIGFTRSLARELGPKGIRVSAIAPGFIDTNMIRDMDQGRKDYYLSATPLRRFGKPEEVAQAAVFLAKSQFMTGHTLVLDGGLTC
ncbi:hypothetical protein HDU67_005053 [Dinochytrium kinnereticum]|nr:hypothetical protein HDU67_005053 [Dinochytrium kinnereticum]